MHQIESRYATAPTTDRRAGQLAHYHGFASLADLASRLPDNAHVIDVGAGASKLGHKVALLRPDISWTNFDYSYNDPNILGEIINDDTPDNITAVPGDATALDQVYEPETFDVVLSYWMVPHLSLYNLSPARKSAAAMFTIAKYGGLLSVGPIKKYPLLPRLSTDRRVKVRGEDSETYADEITEKTRLRGARLIMQRANNEAATAAFGTTRHIRRSDKARIPLIPIDGSDKYAPPLDPRTFVPLGRLTIAMTHQFLRSETYRKIQD